MEDKYLDKLKENQCYFESFMELRGMLGMMETKLNKVCLICKKPLNGYQTKFCSLKCAQRGDYLNRGDKIRKYSREYYYKNYDRNFKRKQKSIKNWYKKNKKRQYKNVLRNYKENKEIWNERHFVNRHRKIILKYINSSCPICGNKVKVIHHKVYGSPHLLLLRNKEHNELVLKEYSKNLIGFCSKICHRNFERGVVTQK